MSIILLYIYAIIVPYQIASMIITQHYKKMLVHIIRNLI